MWPLFLALRPADSPYLYLFPLYHFFYFPIYQHNHHQSSSFFVVVFVVIMRACRNRFTAYFGQIRWWSESTCILTNEGPDPSRPIRSLQIGWYRGGRNGLNPTQIIVGRWVSPHKRGFGNPTYSPYYSIIIKHVNKYFNSSCIFVYHNNFAFKTSMKEIDVWFLAVNNRAWLCTKIYGHKLG